MAKIANTPSTGTAKQTGKPRRPWTAYNFFFRDERAKMLGIDPPPLDCPHNEERKKKRKHRKTHGMIGFTQLSQNISKKWKELDPESKQFYHDMHEEDKKRYRRDVAELSARAVKTTEDISSSASVSSGNKKREREETGVNYLPSRSPIPGTVRLDDSRSHVVSPITPPGLASPLVSSGIDNSQFYRAASGMMDHVGSLASDLLQGHQRMHASHADLTYTDVGDAPQVPGHYHSLAALDDIYSSRMAKRQRGVISSERHPTLASLLLPEEREAIMRHEAASLRRGAASGLVFDRHDIGKGARSSWTTDIGPPRPLTPPMPSHHLGYSAGSDIHRRSLSPNLGYTSARESFLPSVDGLDFPIGNRFAPRDHFKGYDALSTEQPRRLGDLPRHERGMGPSPVGYQVKMVPVFSTEERGHEWWM